ncbi:hypothetical protein JTE90_014174 [Oedothorax gibbosus]|uniref:Uncharacterized protein n=1 Tax=Oedothorax gibbosus TaxID=931172 RepID=A0AAV6VIK7_9ARAC|nr:hypothetical protein JTE90_014174 [Oedothorax gibbosus]
MFSVAVATPSTQRHNSIRKAGEETNIRSSVGNTIGVRRSGRGSTCQRWKSRGEIGAVESKSNSVGEKGASKQV